MQNRNIFIVISFGELQLKEGTIEECAKMKNALKNFYLTAISKTFFLS